MKPHTPITVLGGNGAAGRYFMNILRANARPGEFVSRRPMDGCEGITTRCIDLATDMAWELRPGSVVVSFLPLWILVTFLPRLGGAGAIIATGSTSRFSKSTSADVVEKTVASKLEHAENELIAWASSRKIPWTLLRPTLIYDGIEDKNVTRMAQFIRRWGFLPLASPGCGRRQPIHTEDVARAAFLAIHNGKAQNRAFNISGGEILSYRVMAERIFEALRLPPRFFLLPTSLLQRLFHIATKIGIVKETSFGASMFQRMNEDLIFDTHDGLDALDYRPRAFRPNFHFARGTDVSSSARAKSS